MTGNLFIGFCMIFALVIAGFTVRDAVKSKSETWWFRLIEFMFSLLFVFCAVLLSGQLR